MKNMHVDIEDVYENYADKCYVKTLKPRRKAKAFMYKPYEESFHSWESSQHQGLIRKHAPRMLKYAQRLSGYTHSLSLFELHLDEYVKKQQKIIQWRLNIIKKHIIEFAKGYVKDGVVYSCKRFLNLQKENHKAAGIHNLTFSPELYLPEGNYIENFPYEGASFRYVNYKKHTPLGQDRCLHLTCKLWNNEKIEWESETVFLRSEGVHFIDATEVFVPGQSWIKGWKPLKHPWDIIKHTSASKATCKKYKEAWQAFMASEPYLTKPKSAIEEWLGLVKNDYHGIKQSDFFA